MQPSNLPIHHATHRLEFVDALRGFALLGVFGANLLVFSGYADFMTEAQQASLPTSSTDRVVHFVEQLFVENKFMGLFSFLFGVSFWLFLERSNARGTNSISLFYRRLGWLFVIGAIHGWLLWCFDILRFYALWGLLLPLFIRASHKKLLSFALFFALVAPALIRGFLSLLGGPTASDPAIRGLAIQTFSSGSYLEVLRVNWLYDWYLTLSVSQIAYQVAVLGRLLLGLYAARTLITADLKSHNVLLRTVFIGGAIAGIVGNVVFAGQLLDAAAASGGFFFPFLRRLIIEVGYLGLTLAYASGLALLFQTSHGKQYLMLLAPVGRMALTCYLSQTLFALWLFYGFMPGPGLMGRIGPTWISVIWLTGYVLQVWFASAWLRRFRFGPAEWLWRSLTYGKLQPLRTRMQAVS